ncbi:MAG: D-glycero-alpha-D-manno-heptose-1,7-bisphosphate 7-phosphatase [Candidatus Velamenicoccus archaeovorus]
MAVIGRPAAFLDKDGTLVEDVPYGADPARLRLLPGVGEALRLLGLAGLRLIVVTNQAGVAMGRFPEARLGGIEAGLRGLLRAEGVELDGFLWCPHHPEGTVPSYAVACDCRKPRPGLLRRAAMRYRVDLRRSWAVGDILDDVEAGHLAGCRAALVDTGGETEWRIGPEREPDLIAKDLLEAARAIVFRARPAHPAVARGGAA